MHTLILSYDYKPAIGGMGELVQKLTGHMRSAHPTDTWTVVSPSTDADERVGGLRWRKFFGCPFFSLALFFRLPSIVRSLAPDVVHAHAGSGGVFVLRRLSVPLLVTAHHTYMQEVRYVFAHHPIKRWTKWLMSLPERRTYRIADRVTAVSLDTKKALMRDYGIPEEKIAVIENPVSLADTPNTERQPSTILSVGRIEPRKGTKTLLAAFTKVRETHADLKLRLVGRNMMGSRLPRMLLTLGLEKHVEVLGHVDDQRFATELRSATCVVTPALLEGFGLAAAQSMLAGACTIVTDVPGLRCLVRNGETGIVVLPGDPDLLASALSRVLEDPALREKLGAAAATEAASRFSLSARAEEYTLEYRLLTHA